MSDNNPEKHGESATAGKSSDSEESLQEELTRETAEGGDSVGDIGSNRTLSGSSTWETQPDKGNEAGDSSSATRKGPNKPQ